MNELPRGLPGSRARRDPLVTATCIVVIVAVFGWAFDTVRQHLAAAAAAATAAASGPKGPQAGKLEEISYTNGEAAHVTVTNLNSYSVQSCFRAVIEGKAGGKVESVPVCTGELKPRTTTTLVAPYRVGAIERLCEGDADRWGNRHIDWSRCTFTTSAVE